MYHSTNIHMKKTSDESTKWKRYSAIKRKYDRKLASSKDVEAVDRISRLPDEILVSILSRLTVKEAISTSVLSTCWRRLYTRIDRLNFPPFRLSGEGKLRRFLDTQKRFLIYVDAIDRTLDSCTSETTLKEFSVDMLCLKGASLERWLRFALSSRQVQTIKIRMRVDDVAPLYYYPLQLTNLILPNLDGSLPGLQCLKELSFCGVRVEDLEVGMLLANFPLLESLSISKSNTLKNISIDGRDQTLKLKHLEISYAQNLKTVEIRHLANLVSLEWYVGKNQVSTLWLSNVPKLTEFRTSALGIKTLPTLDIRDQLRLLKLSYDQNITPMAYFTSCKLVNVETLELKLYTKLAYSFFSLTDPCTWLEILRVKFLSETDQNDDNMAIADLPRRRSHCSNLKKLVVSEYDGNTREFQFVYYIVNNFTGLKQLIIKLRNATPRLRQIFMARARIQFGAITTKKRMKLVINQSWN